MCSEDFAQEMVQEGLKKVVIQNYSDSHNSDRFATFKNGILTLDHYPVINADQIEDRVHNIQTVVEKEI